MVEVNAGSATAPDLEMVKRALREVLNEGADAAITPRFLGGTVKFVPADITLQAKELPVEEFFKKIIRVRDQLRVLEQRLNNHPKLTEEERTTFQGYITRCYGAMTAFNMLFKEKQDHFVGQKGLSREAPPGV